MSKRTIILGASTNPDRVSYTAAYKLKGASHEFFPIGIKKGEVAGKEISHSKEILPEIDTITLYLGAENQREWYNYILETHPKRVIFNPGAENGELASLLEKQGIEVVQACTLVLLATKNY